MKKGDSNDSNSSVTKDVLNTGEAFESEKIEISWLEEKIQVVSNKIIINPKFIFSYKHPLKNYWDIFVMMLAV